MAIIKANKIKLFENIAQFDIEGIYYDFHNDYSCTRVSLSEDSLELMFLKSLSDEKISLRFLEVEIFMLDLMFCEINKGLTIDSIYRGRFEVGGFLNEFNEMNKSFIYIEFYEGQAIELFCERIEVSVVKNL